MEPTKRSTRKELTPVEFRKLTKAQKKVTVAKDVIAQIKAHKYRAETGRYIGDVKIGEEYAIAKHITGDIQKRLPELHHCEVCAVGSCILSITKYENKLKWTDVGRVPSECSSITDKILTKVFTPNELVLIEVMFEGCYTNGVDNYGKDKLGGVLTEEAAIKAKLWYNKYPDPEKRLLAIMRRIVKNEGVITI